jgi:hypothetical protein
MDIFDEEWDTLVILDACRFDIFAEQNTLSGTLERRKSRSSHTSEFLRGNFNGKTLHDTVYTTVSPQLERHRQDIDVEFHAVNNIWNTDRWNEDEGTVTPDEMTDAALEIHEKYPNKRHIVHYMQPHYPFIGSEIDKGSRGFDQQKSEKFDIWEQIMRGQMDINPSEIWSSYCHNLDLALEAVKDLYETVDGKIVITSDHGNMIGERSSPIPIQEWGHPSSTYTRLLVTVPWLENHPTRRRDIRSDPPKATQSVTDSVVGERLRDLGYV